jgi:hypothetical protein
MWSGVMLGALLISAGATSLLIVMGALMMVVH